MQILRAQCVMLLLCLHILFVPESLANERANASFYIDTFGSVNPESNRKAARAQQVFKQLKRASAAKTATAKLVIINAEGAPWALALGDGNVVLSKGALDIIYSSGREDVGDAWLSFVLGHELAHLGSRDLWQQHVFASLSAISDDESSGLSEVQDAMLSSAYDLEAWRERELKADELGYVIAALAGFEVERIFADSVSKADFLKVWEAQTLASGNTHYSASIRTSFLEHRLAVGASKLDQFQLGLMLSHYGRYEDALTIFEDFQSYFSSREVLSNLGYLHLQLAREAMPVSMAYRFWYPTLLESDAGMRLPSRSFLNALPDNARNHILDAVRYLEKALDLEPGNRTVSSNLAVAYLYLGKLFRSRAIVEESLDLHPVDTNLLLLRSLVLAEQEPEVDLWPKAVDNLKSLDGENNSHQHPHLLFNLARLHEERGRLGQAGRYWLRLLELGAIVPSVYQYQACAALEITCNQLNDLNDKEDATSKTLSSFLPFRIGQNLETIQQARGDLEIDYWQVQEISGATIKHGRATAFVLDDVIELIRYQADSDRIDGLLLDQEFIKELTMIGRHQVTRYTGGISALSAEGSVNEIWVSR